MKTQLQQGDVILKRIGNLPDGVVEVKRKNGAIVLAEGDTVQAALNFRARNLIKSGENWNPEVLT